MITTLSIARFDSIAGIVRMYVRECKRALKLEDMELNERPTKLRVHRSKVKDRVGSSQEFWAAAFVYVHESQSHRH
jgi:hypothetical protein